ncbi:MAG: hypothetical protein NVS1B6_17620 [Steroidobacteraceae bacterium]
MQEAKRKPFAAILGALAESLALAGCAGNGAGLDANGQPLVPGGQASGPLTAEFSSIQAHVFTPICTVCHAGAGAPYGLRLDAPDSYNLLVGVPSVEIPGLFRVRPGDPDNSYLVQKLEGHAAVGERMPLGGPYLSSEVIAVVRQWITGGAPSSSANTMPASFAVVAVSPAANDVLTEAPPQIMIGFNHELDVTRIYPETVRLERRTADSAGVSVEIVPAHAAVPSANLRTLLLWPAERLKNGRYRVVLRVAEPLGLADLAGEALHSTDSNEALITSFDLEAAP